MGAYRNLYFRKKFIECLLIHAVDISSCIHSNHYVVFVGPLGCLVIGNLRCFPYDPLVASIWLTSLNIFTLGGFGCLTPFSSMWVSSSSLVVFEQDWLSDWLFSWSGIPCGNVQFCGSPCTLHSQLDISVLAGDLVFHISCTFHPGGFSRLMTRIRTSLCSTIILSLTLSTSSFLFVALALVLSTVICSKVH